MSGTFRFYRFEGYSYRVEEDADGKPIGCYQLQLDGSWSPVTWGWQAILISNVPIPEEQAFMLAGIKNLNTLIPNLNSSDSNPTTRDSPPPAEQPAG